MNTFKPTEATTIAGYIASLPAERKRTIVFLHDFIRKATPKLRAHFARNMIGYGTFEYVDHKKEKLDWPIIALASQKNYVSIYVCALVDGKYVAEAHKALLGKVSVGKSCIRFTKLEHLNLPALKQVIRQAARKPGLGTAS